MGYHLRRWAIALLLATLAVTPLGHHARAQGNAPTLNITLIDTSHYPEVNVFVHGSNLGGDLNTMPVSIVENGEAIQPVLQDIAEIGTQTAVLIDASGSILDAGIEGQPRFVDVSNIVRRGIQSGALSSQSDWLGVFAPDAEGKMQVINGWTRDHGAVANSLSSYRPPDGNARETPLYDLLFFTLDNMKNEEAPPNVYRSILLFSDGVTGNSSLNLDDAVRRAADEGIPINTVLLGPGTDQTRLDMQRIATLSGGQTFQLNRPEALDGLWPAIGALRLQNKLTYRSPHANPSDITITATLPSGQTATVSSDMPGLSIDPATVTFIQPDTSIEVKREGILPDTPVEELLPDSIEVEIGIAWPNDQERAIRRVEYTLHTETVSVADSPFTTATIPISKLDSGRYTLRAVVIDELGVESESDPITIEITTVRPEPAAPRGLGIEVAGIFIPIGVLVGGASVLAISLGVLALVATLGRSKKSEESADERSYTPPPPVSRNPAPSKGRLVVEDRGRATTLPSILEIPSGTTRIGRAAEYANLVIDDPRVSRVHCRISDDAQGNLCLYDEPGSSGTYVNYNPISIEGYVLQSNDVIHIGPVQVRFHYTNQAAHQPGQGGSGYTEVYSPPPTSL